MLLKMIPYTCTSILLYFIQLLHNQDLLKSCHVFKSNQSIVLNEENIDISTRYSTFSVLITPLFYIFVLRFFLFKFGNKCENVKRVLSPILFFSYPTALQLVSKGLVNVKALISHRFTIDESLKAFQTAASRDTKAVKVIIQCEPNQCVMYANQKEIQFCYNVSGVVFVYLHVIPKLLVFSFLY